MEFSAWTFLSGAAGGAGYFFFAAELDEVAQDDAPNSTFFMFDEDEEEDEGFGKFDEIVGWPAISLATTKPPGEPRLVVAVSPHGECWELHPATGDEQCGVIAGRFHLRRLAVVDHQIFACGMNRVVLKRDGFARWAAIGPGPDAADPAVVGFEDIGGFSEAEMYAVGWGGEIWWRDGGQWRRADSPTNANLCALACAPDGSVYVAGHDGVMLRGRHDQWQLIETTRRDDLRDVAVFDGQVFVVTDFAIFRLTEAGLAPEADFVDTHDLPATCLHLLEASDGLVSLGQKDVFIRSDGLWRRLV